MLRNIFLKTLYEKRWTLFAWGLAIFLLTILTMSFYPTLRDTFGESLKNVPDSAKAFLGDATAYQTIQGFTDLQVFAQMVFFTIIMGVILGTGLLAGEENEGTLQTLLSMPVSRPKVYIQKLFACMAIVAGVCMVLMLAILLGALMVGEKMPLGRTFLATMMLWLVTMVFTVLGYALGAIFSRRGLSGAAAGMLAFVTYLITALAPNVHVLKIPNYFSPFHYFNNPSILKYGLGLRDLAVLLSINVVLAVLGYVVFVKRDVYQK
jgi:ABC-2 type transport system permease protein